MQLTGGYLQAELALRSLHIEGPNLQQLLGTEHHQTTLAPDLLQQYKLQGLTFDEFCCVYAELKYILSKPVSGSLLASYLSTPLRWITSKG